MWTLVLIKRDLCPSTILRLLIIEKCSSVLYSYTLIQLKTLQQCTHETDTTPGITFQYEGKKTLRTRRDYRNEQMGMHTNPNSTCRIKECDGTFKIKNLIWNNSIYDKTGYLIKISIRLLVIITRFQNTVQLFRKYTYKNSYPAAGLNIWGEYRLYNILNDFFLNFHVQISIQ